MTDTMELTHIEVDLELLVGSVEACESVHKTNAGHHYGPCAVEAVARWSATCPRGRSIVVCTRVVQYVEMVRDTDLCCNGCKRPTSECWVIRPL